MALQVMKKSQTYARASETTSYLLDIIVYSMKHTGFSMGHLANILDSNQPPLILLDLVSTSMLELRRDLK